MSAGRREMCWNDCMAMGVRCEIRTFAIRKKNDETKNELEEVEMRWKENKLFAFISWHGIRNLLIFMADIHSFTRALEFPRKHIQKSIHFCICITFARTTHNTQCSSEQPMLQITLKAIQIQCFELNEKCLFTFYMFFLYLKWSERKQYSFQMRLNSGLRLLNVRSSFSSQTFTAW